jgi:hypothetical protein
VGYYFSIDQRGKGTPYVESLLSYWARLSRAHGLTTNQLAAHMSVWAKKRGLPFPVHIHYGRPLAMCGIGRDVGRLVEVIELATGTHGLSAGTLLALRPVISEKTTGAVRRTKAWCPRCYEEDMAEYDECYDRLLWAFTHVERCPIHRLRLEATCPSCAAKQRLARANGDLGRCHDCGAHLIGAPSRWKVMLEPTLGERELSQMLSYIAAVGGAAFVEGAFQIYESMAAQIRRSRLLLGDDPKSKRPMKISVPKPFLRTLLRVVVADGADLVTLLTDPSAAVSHAQMLDGFGVNFDVVRRAHRPRDVLTHASAILEETAIDPHRPSLASACRRAGISTGYARYHFADLSGDITRRWRAGCSSQNTKKARKAIRLLLDIEWARYETGEHRSQDALVDELVKQTCCSVRVARLLIAARIHRDARAQGLESTDPGVPELASGDDALLDAQTFSRVRGLGLESASAILSTYVRERKLFRIGARGKRFPAFQFSESGFPKPVIAAMLNSVKRGDESRFHWWMLTPHGVLSGLRPVDVLDDARSKLLPDLARVEFE